MDERLSIRVSIADRFYPLRVDPGDEERIRRAAKLINEKVLQYKNRYADKDPQDFLAMASLQFVIKLLQQEESTDINPILDDVRDINEELEAFLNKE